MAIKRIDKDVEVIIANNTTGGFFYQAANGSFIIDLDNNGDEDYVTFGDLKSIMARKRKHLENLDLIIIDVLDDELTVKDVVEALRLNDSYSELASLKEQEEDPFTTELVRNFVVSTDSDKLVKILTSSKSKLKNRIYEASIEAYRDKELVDFNKMQAIAKAMGHGEFHAFWQDSEISSK